MTDKFGISQPLYLPYISPISPLHLPKAMTDKFGISQPDTDVRALLINPARWAEI